MAPPACRTLGRHCHALDVAIRVASLEGSEDHDGTWMLGHTERVTFGPLTTTEDELWTTARLHIPCRHLRQGTGDHVRCLAHGFVGEVPAPERPEQSRQLGGDRFRVVDGRRMVTRELPLAPRSRRELPMQESSNPCATARCRTADGKIGAACCRDMQVEVRCPPEHDLLESLLRHRKAPYLCKVDREQDDDEMVTVEILSACGYLLEDGISCALHGRHRPDGRVAKPELCSAWPKKRTGLHPGCAFRSRKVPL